MESRRQRPEKSTRKRTPMIVGRGAVALASGKRNPRPSASRRWDRAAPFPSSGSSSCGFPRWLYAAPSHETRCCPSSQQRATHDDREERRRRRERKPRGRSRACGIWILKGTANGNGIICRCIADPGALLVLPQYRPTSNRSRLVLADAHSCHAKLSPVHTDDPP
ncbi:hypothetical protein HN011_005567 [Eciton burchellii]|nr:hypothetical protein HN011_005567 [Eciton burchellii]